MIVEVLALTEGCREGNCPTFSLTDHGSVVVQGAAGTPATRAIPTQRDRTAAVEVPADIMHRAAAGLTARGIRPSATAALDDPALHGAWPADVNAFLVRGATGTVDVRSQCPPVDEAVVELDPEAIVTAVRMASTHATGRRLL